MPTHRIPPAQLGWMAGVVDLKGKILRKKNKSRATPQLVLAVESTDIAIVRELCKMTGTQAELQRQPKQADWWRRNCQEHCSDAHVHVEAPEFPAVARWTITGVSMAVIIENLLPYLRTDKGLEIVMEEAYQNKAISGQGSGAVRASLLRLRYMGWVLPPEIDRAIGLMEEGLKAV